jgi:hypothetical protein
VSSFLFTPGVAGEPPLPALLRHLVLSDEPHKPPTSLGGFWCYNVVMIQWEYRESCELNAWLERTRIRFPALRGFHVPNENPGRNKTERMRIGALRKRMGVKSGVCDWFFFYPPNVRIALELKKPEVAGKSYPSKDEKEWLDYFASCGFQAIVARGWNEARVFVERVLKENGTDVKSSPFDDCPF